MIYTPVTLPHNVIVLHNKDIMFRSSWLGVNELAIAIAYDSTTGLYTVQSQDGKRTNTNMQHHLDFKWAT
jgi:hypothetical protein